MTCAFKEPSWFFDYLSAYKSREVQGLLSRPFVIKLEANYKNSLEKECSLVAGQDVKLETENFIEILCWLRLKERVLGLKTYSAIEPQLMIIALRDLNIINEEYALERLAIAKGHWESQQQVSA